MLGALAGSLWLLLTFGTGSAWAEPVTFSVEVPTCTPTADPVMLRSNRLSTDSFRHDALTRVAPTRWEGTFDVAVPTSALRYRYSAGVCDATACPGIEKQLDYIGTGGDLPDRQLPPSTTRTDDHVFIWRSTLGHVDAAGQLTSIRSPTEQVAFCAPYLSVSAASEVTVGYDSLGASRVELEVGLTTAYGTSMVHTGAYRNHFALSDLTPGQRYHYRVVDNGIPGPDHTFTAPHAPGDAFRFAFLGDTQFYGPLQRTDTDAVVAQVIDFDPHLVVAAGDLVASEMGPRGPGSWNEPEMARFSVFFGMTEGLMAHAPFMAAMGNHEEDAFYFWDAFRFPESDAPAIDHYDFRWGHVHFTVLYTGTTDGYDFEGILDSQTHWMERTLEAAALDPEVRFKVVVLHRGPLSQGARHRSDGMAFFETETDLRPSWQTLWERHQVDVVLAGHNHNFTVAELAGVRYVTSCSGAPTHELREPWEPTTRHAEETCTANLFTVGRTLGFEARRLDGSTIDDAAFALCREHADCEELSGPCPAETVWRCESRECVHRCETPTDAGVPDGGTPDGGAEDGGVNDASTDSSLPDDAGGDAGAPPPPAGGCGCRSVPSTAPAHGPVALALLLVVVLSRRIRRRAPVH